MIGPLQVLHHHEPGALVGGMADKGQNVILQALLLLFLLHLHRLFGQFFRQHFLDVGDQLRHAAQQRLKLRFENSGGTYEIGFQESGGKGHTAQPI